MTALDPAEVARQCADAAGGMADLRRFDVPQGTGPEDGHDVHKALLDVRARLDLAEELIRDIRRLRRKARAQALRAAQKADDAFDARLAKLSEGAVRRQYEGAQERLAQARTQNLDLRREARAAERLKVLAEDTFEQLRDAMFGLLNIREELIARLRELQFESALER